MSFWKISYFRIFSYKTYSFNVPQKMVLLQNEKRDRTHSVLHRGNTLLLDRIRALLHCFYDLKTLSIWKFLQSFKTWQYHEIAVALGNSISLRWHCFAYAGQQNLSRRNSPFVARDKGPGTQFYKAQTKVAES